VIFVIFRDLPVLGEDHAENPLLELILEQK
jgi:hypothetical protein